MTEPLDNPIIEEPVPAEPTTGPLPDPLPLDDPDYNPDTDDQPTPDDTE
jgi:hypothetical protein